MLFDPRPIYDRNQIETLAYRDKSLSWRQQIIGAQLEMALLLQNIVIYCANDGDNSAMPSRNLCSPMGFRLNIYYMYMMPP